MKRRGCKIIKENGRRMGNEGMEEDKEIRRRFRVNEKKLKKEGKRDKKEGARYS